MASEYLKKKAEEVWKAYQCFKDDVNSLEAYAKAEGLKVGYKLDFTDDFIDMNEKLGMALEEFFGMTCFEEE